MNETGDKQDDKEDWQLDVMSGSTDDLEAAVEGPGASHKGKIQLAAILEHGGKRK